MGVQEIIWDCRSWWAGAERHGAATRACFDRARPPAKRVDVTTAHRDHVHIGLNRARGAQAHPLLAP